MKGKGRQRKLGSKVAEETEAEGKAVSPRAAWRWWPGPRKVVPAPPTRSPTLRLGLFLWELPPCSRRPSRARHRAAFPCERRLKPASRPGWSWMAPPAQVCTEAPSLQQGPRPFLQGVLFSEENMRTRRQPSIPPLDVGE